VQERVRQRFADELTANHAEQEELTGQIAALQQRLDQLKADEAWLTQAQSSLPTTGEPRAEALGSASETPSAAPVEQAEVSAPAETDAEASQTVPAQRQKQTVKKAAQTKKPAATKPAAKKPAAAKKAASKAPVKKSAAKKTAPAAEKPAVKKPAAKKSAAEQAASPKATAANASAGKAATAKAASPKAAKAPAGKAAAGGPPLWELLLGVLRKTPGQPLVAREVSEQLAKDHPDRVTSAQTVRNGLQTLVSKNLAEKTRQQGNVMYTAHADAPATPPPAGDEPASDKAEQAAEKVPAEVS
jgi:histone H1/5